MLVILTAIAAGLAGFWFGQKSVRPAARRRRQESLQWSPDNHRHRLTDKLLDLDTIKVDDIMIPRSEIASIDISDDWDTIIDTLRSTPHTRLPVCENNLDNIIGILHMKKVAHALARSDLTRERLLQMAREREGYFVPEGTTLSVQLLNFQRDRRRIALVVDEYGDIRGLVTLEDILEEIVGDFTSAPGALHQDIHREAEGSFVDEERPRTLNGLILEYLETIPQPGTGLKLGDLSIEILQTADNTVKTARVRPIGLRVEDIPSKGAA